MRTQKFQLYVVCGTKGCPEPIQVSKFDGKEHYCEKCEKKMAKAKVGSAKSRTSKPQVAKKASRKRK